MRGLTIRLAAVITIIIGGCIKSATTPGPGPTPQVGTSAAQGVRGQVTIGPMCPVQSATNPCPDRPYVATILIRDVNGGSVTTTRSSADGRYQVGLPPGTYFVVPQRHQSTPGGPVDVYPVPQDSILATVDAGVWDVVDLKYDSGIR